MKHSCHVDASSERASLWRVHGGRGLLPKEVPKRQSKHEVSVRLLVASTIHHDKRKRRDLTSWLSQASPGVGMQLLVVVLRAAQQWIETVYLSKCEMLADRLLLLGRIMLTNLS